MPRRLMVPVLAICTVLGAVCPSAAQPNTVLNVTALPSPCPSAVPNSPGPSPADSSDAFDCAVLLLPANGGEIYVPAGKYYLSRAVYVTDRNVMFRGEGRRVSTLIWNGGFSNGLAFQSTSTEVNYTLGVRSLSLLKGGWDGRAAIRAQWMPIGLSNNPGNGHRALGVVTTTIHDVQIGSADWDSSSVPMWYLGIELVDSTAAYISQFDISGRTWDFADEVFTAAIHIGGEVLMPHTKSIATKIRDGRITRYKHGIETRNAEGSHVEYVTMQEVKRGIKITNGVVGTALTNNRILAIDKGVELIGVSHITVSHNRIERFGSANFMGIRVVNSLGPRLIANSIMSPADLDEHPNGIVLEGNVQDAVIQQNNTLNMDAGVWLVVSSVIRSMVVGNINRDAIVSPVLDNGASTYKESNH